MKITKKDLFVDELDGKWTLGLNMDIHGTISIGNFDFDEDEAWLYPEDLSEGIENIINVWLDENNKWQFNIYDLPENWRDIVTNDSGLDGKKSIHDIMILVS